MAKFIIKETKTGIKFDLDINSHIVCTSEVYTTLSACKNGIESVKKNSALNKIEDLTIEDSEKLTNPKFEIYEDKKGHFRFRLKASNGQIIAVSEDFKDKKDCLKVIDLIVKEAPNAEVVEVK
ncbi:DUF1508 domain-containing protein (tandem domains) [Campylobacter blaseri]|uniref:DUF1508 domain-containing protein n=1 Tax=Campylobacter blaseri TaxID=2042961 RepID=A0A2P8R3W4_9BACT|nr:DUF1508 domain-containing protein [Campylobacter blaseri]PSM53192.1 hypothetical protein CQ405_01195 [Campylobacter blaseri]PSM54658.1 hypothetical protein CRN67_01195 [Campylobacter blaseri]QKF86865.1 DUF1508 domain-containing protein (tandem domains) [Campylobacter blaseri]